MKSTRLSLPSILALGTLSIAPAPAQEDPASPNASRSHDERHAPHDHLNRKAPRELQREESRLHRTEAGAPDSASRLAGSPPSLPTAPSPPSGLAGGFLVDDDGKRHPIIPINPFAGASTSGDPFAGPPTSINPFAGASTSGDPFAFAHPPSGDPFAGPPTSINPFAGASPSGDPFALAHPSADLHGSLDLIWPAIQKALERLDVDSKIIERARDLASGYLLSPPARYRIGVQCNALPPSLASQLSLDHGIIVDRVFPDSPATEAGLQTHDILLKAHEIALHDVNDLVAAVQAAADKESAMSMELLRKGKSLTVAVSPEKIQDEGVPLLGSVSPGFLAPANGLLKDPDSSPDHRDGDRDSRLKGKTPRRGSFETIPPRPRMTPKDEASIDQLKNMMQALRDTVENLKQEIEEPENTQNETRSATEPAPDHAAPSAEPATDPREHRATRN